MALRFAFDNSYARLPDRFHARQAPTPVAQPGLIKVNQELALELGLDPEALASPKGVAVLAGNLVPRGAEPLAQAYAGHQFGGWSPQLGDGRAILLGEVIDRHGVRRDIQLKGSGPTPFSRRGDGRAWVGPVIREYIVSEAMHAMGVPTTRALAAVTTGEWVLREDRLPGAVLCRVASSHIRVGTLQYFAARGDVEALAILTEQVILRHYPGVAGPLGVLEAAVAAQAHLIAQWMGLGFIHGVMNTDNCHVGGETIDYGPCAFMDAYHPDTVFSSIDQHGRYAYSNQPQIAAWNLAQLASCLLPLLGEKEAAIATATAAVHRFAGLYQAAWLARFGAKLGFGGTEAGDGALIEGLLDRMAAQGADFTRTFRGLADRSARDEFTGPQVFDDWAVLWQERLAREGDPEAAAGRMRRANPAFIPRNHQVQAVIEAAVLGDYGPFERLSSVLAVPFEDQPDAVDLQAAPWPDQVVRQTFCGT